MKKEELARRVSKAVRTFWTTRNIQQMQQGKSSGAKDYGSRSAVTGGAQLDGFVRLFAEIIADAGIAHPNIFYSDRRMTYLPGFFRPMKAWDLLVVVGNRLLACVECKSQVGSFGNNFNNRSEEAIGNAADFWTAYRDGAFRESPRPWLGYFMLLEEAPGSMSPVRTPEPHYPVFEEFRNASYAKRYEILCRKLVRERMYDAACLMLSGRDGGQKGRYREPCDDLSFTVMTTSLSAQATAYARIHGES